VRNLLALVLTVLVAATTFSAWTFGWFEHLKVWAWFPPALVVVLIFLPTSLLSRRVYFRWLAILNILSAVAVGFLSFFLLAALVSWAALAVVRMAGLGTDSAPIATVAYLGAALLGCAGLFSAYRLRLTRVTIPLAHLPRFWAGRTIALVSDLHLGNLRGAAFSGRVVSRLSQLGAECVLVGGDMFDGVKTNVARAVGPWADLKAPSGVFFVGGNHDDYGGRRGYFAALRHVGLRELANEKVELHGIQLVGVHDGETHRPDTFKAILDKADLDANRPSILLAHRPENLEVPERAGIDLQLSGHTHGGQFWPWTHIARRVHGQFAQGLARFGRMQVFTSTGAGTWGPPFRLGTRAEIVLIRLEPA